MPTRLSFGRSRGRLYAQEDIGITFDDVAGIDPGTAERFGLGYAPDAWRELRAAAATHALDESVLLEVGLLKVGDRNPDPEIARLELALTELGNSIGMGAMGFVGSSVVLFLIGGFIAFTTLERALEFLIDWAGEDVSEDPRYYNVNLVKTPYRDW